MTFTNVAIIGAGNMGASLAHGILAKGFPKEHMTIADPSLEKLKSFADAGIKTTTDNVVAIQNADVILLAIKPALMSEVLHALAKVIQNKKPLLISIAAGVREKSIDRFVGGQIPIVRAMPNTPAMMGCGATALFANTHVNAENKNLAETLLRSVGITVWVEEESLMDAVTALSGSGPAYFFLVIEALQNAGEKLGLSPEVARLLSLQTAYGACRMALESEKNVEQLRQDVTSPQGTTEAAIKILQKENLSQIFLNALTAANARAKELAEMIDQ